jgi:hypothetical protein
MGSGIKHNVLPKNSFKILPGLTSCYKRAENNIITICKVRSKTTI